MAYTTHLEIERKYEAEGADLPGFTRVGPVASVDDAVRVGLDAVYYDTAGLALAAARVAVRRRTGGADAGWHVKFDAAGGRTELGRPLGPDDGTVPADLVSALPVAVSAAELRPVARIRNDRIVRVLRAADGTALAEFCDDHVLARGPRGELRWREWEVELADPPPTEDERTALLDVLERAILAAGGRPSASGSKLARALGADDDVAPAATSGTLDAVRDDGEAR